MPVSPVRRLMAAVAGDRVHVAVVGIVMSKAVDDPGVLSEQILLFRSYVKLLLAPVRH